MPAQKQTPEASPRTGKTQTGFTDAVIKQPYYMRGSAPQIPAKTVNVMARIAQHPEAAKFGIGSLLKLQQLRGKINREDLISSNIFLVPCQS